MCYNPPSGPGGIGGCMKSVTQRDWFHLNREQSHLMDTTDYESALWMRRFHGEKLSRSERRRLARADKRHRRNFLIELAILAAIFCPLAVFLSRAWGWR